MRHAALGDLFDPRRRFSKAPVIPACGDRPRAGKTDEHGLRNIHLAGVDGFLGMTVPFHNPYAITPHCPQVKRAIGHYRRAAGIPFVRSGAMISSKGNAPA